MALDDDGRLITERGGVVGGNKRLYLVGALGSVALILLCPIVAQWHTAYEGPKAHFVRMMIGYLGRPICTLTAIGFLKDLFSRKPMVTVDERGIGLGGEPPVPWDQVADIRPVQQGEYATFIGVFACDVEQVARSFPPRAAKRALRTAAWTGGAVQLVREGDLPIPIAALIEQIKAYRLASSSIR